MNIKAIAAAGLAVVLLLGAGVSPARAIVVLQNEVLPGDPSIFANGTSLTVNGSLTSVKTVDFTFKACDRCRSGYRPPLPALHVNSVGIWGSGDAATLQAAIFRLIPDAPASRPENWELVMPFVPVQTAYSGAQIRPYHLTPVLDDDVLPYTGEQAEQYRFALWNATPNTTFNWATPYYIRNLVATNSPLYMDGYRYDFGVGALSRAAPFTGTYHFGSTAASAPASLVLDPSPSNIYNAFSLDVIFSTGSGGGVNEGSGGGGGGTAPPPEAVPLPPSAMGIAFGMAALAVARRRRRAA